MTSIADLPLSTINFSLHLAILDALSPHFTVERRFTAGCDVLLIVRADDTLTYTKTYTKRVQPAKVGV